MPSTRRLPGRRAAVPWLLCALVAAVVPGPARAADRVRMLVLPPSAGNSVDPKVVSALDDLILAEYAKLGLYEVLGRAEVATLLSAARDRQLTGCETEACLAELGGVIGAPFLAVTNIAAIGERYLVNLKVLDVDAAKTVRRTSVEIPGDDEQLIAAVRRGIREMHPELESDRGAPVSAGLLVAGGACALASLALLVATYRALDARNASTGLDDFYREQQLAQDRLFLAQAVGGGAAVLGAVGLGGLVLGF